MDKYDLMSDPCDNQIIRFNNFMQMLSCICSLLAMFIPELQDAAELIRFIADIVFMITASCMNAQAHNELKEQKNSGSSGNPNSTPGYAQAPKLEQMDHRPNHQQQHHPPHQQQPVVAHTAPVGQQRTFLVEIPPNVYAGTQLQVQAPNGQQVMFAVPPGAYAGQQVMVPY